MGSIAGQPVTVLIDTGSSHNIIQSRLAAFLHLPVTPFPEFSVMVDNGELLQCSGLSLDVPLCLQTHIFKVPLYLLPIQGADVVLGMASLGTLGTVLSDFSVPSMSFTYNGVPITLSQKLPSIPSQMSHSQLTRAQTANAIAQFCTILCWTTTNSNTSFWALTVSHPTLPLKPTTPCPSH